MSFRDAFVFVTFIAAIVKAFPSRRVFVCLGSYFYLCLVVRVFACVFRHASLQRECFDKQRRGVKCLFEHMLESLLRAARAVCCNPVSFWRHPRGCTARSPSHPHLFCNPFPLCNDPPLAPSRPLSHKYLTTSTLMEFIFKTQIIPVEFFNLLFRKCHSSLLILSFFKILAKTASAV